jgi:catechol 2,3-dioxygenase-like lactoylglutathione lyase family enzyme
MRFFDRARSEQAMKRFHVHIGVPDLAASIDFYSNLFGMAPSVKKDDYAKWMLEDPRVNFAISDRNAHTGLNHLGLQAESADELAAIRQQFAAADAAAIVDESNVNCCYARGNKHWTQDPQGIAWEAFHTLNDIPLFNAEVAPQAVASSCGTTADACCVPGEAAPKPNVAPVARAGCCS